jgi:mono/diheme cytochrome c family protein/cytochrome c553
MAFGMSSGKVSLIFVERQSSHPEFSPKAITAMFLAAGLAFVGGCGLDTTTPRPVALPHNGEAGPISAATPGRVGSTDPTTTIIPATDESPIPTLPEPGAPAATRSVMRAPPISGGTLTILSDGRTAVAADSDRDQVYVVDLVTSKLTATIALRPGDEPGRVIEDGAGRVHVALRSGGAVVTLDPARGTVLARRALCPAPRGLAFASGVLHVACAGGELVSIDAAPTALVPQRTLNLDRDLRDVLVTGSRLMVTTFRASDVLIVDGGTTTRFKLPQDSRFRMSPAVAWRMVAGPGGKTMVLHQQGSDFEIGTTQGGYSRGFCGGIVNSAITVFAPDGSPIFSSGSLQGALVGADLALSPDGTQVAVVSIGGADQGRQVQFFAIDTTGSAASFPDNIGPCQAPLGRPQVPRDDRSDAATHTWLPRPADYLPPNGQVVAVAFDPRGNVIVQSREPATLQILTQRVDPVALSADSRFDAGHQLFHTATSGQIACVSCHPEGGEDGRVWHFQVGARRTQSLRGGIMNTAPFHWNGDQSDMTSLMQDVFQGRMGGDVVDTAHLFALGTWLNQIPTIPTSRWTDDATVARGKAVFAAVGCAACHAGSDFTNGQTVDVGTGGAFQVPQLHGLGFRAPYMHTGCASTLHARFSSGCGGDDRHGATSALSQAQIGDVIAYLDTL